MPEPVSEDVAPIRYPLRTRLRSLAKRGLRQPAGRLWRAAAFRTGLVPERTRKVFCIGMQRSGTTSFGRFCATELGLAHRGFDVSIANGWGRAWMQGAPERILAAPDFRTGEVFEDDPWWYPRFYEFLAPRFPDAKFVLITRDADAWFRSLMAHSGGRAPGYTDLHAAAYGRQSEFEALQARAGSWRKVKWQGLSLGGMDEHYKARYRAHAADARAWFAAHAPDRLIDIRLEDPEKFRKVALFLGFPDRDYPDVHVNAIASRERQPVPT
jgi:Sulfotransferase domain